MDMNTHHEDIATDRNSTIAAIRTNLKARSGKAWSVKGGTGTAWGWITIAAPPRRCDTYGGMSDTDRTELAELLGVIVHHQGVSVPAQSDYRRFYLAASAGEPTDITPVPAWD